MSFAAARYDLFRLRLILRGFLNTRRYWRLVAHDPRTVAMLMTRWGKAPLIIALGGLGIAASFTIMHRLPGILGIVAGAFMWLVTLSVCLLLGFAEGGPLKTSPRWGKYREVLHLAVTRVTLASMGLRLNGYDIETEAGEKIALLEPESDHFDIYIPNQARLVSRIARMDNRQTRQHVMGFFTMKNGRAFAGEGMQRLFQTAFLYRQLAHSQPCTPQAGFGAMLLQQGEAVSDLYGKLAFERYAALSWYGIEPTSMVTFADAPEFLVGSLYPDQTPVWYETYLSHVKDAKFWITRRTHDDTYDDRATAALLREYRQHLATVDSAVAA